VGRASPTPIDAHLAVLTALQLDTTKLPTPRADGDREALRILLCARQELTTTATAQTNRLRALLRHGDDCDRDLARRTRLSGSALATLARRRQPPAPAAPRWCATPSHAYHCLTTPGP
jgi:transposase